MCAVVLHLKMQTKYSSVFAECLHYACTLRTIYELCRDSSYIEIRNYLYILFRNGFHTKLGSFTRTSKHGHMHSRGATVRKHVHLCTSSLRDRAVHETAKALSREFALLKPLCMQTGACASCTNRVAGAWKQFWITLNPHFEACTNLTIQRFLFAGGR